MGDGVTLTLNLIQWRYADSNCNKEACPFRGLCNPYRTFRIFLTTALM